MKTATLAHGRLLEGSILDEQIKMERDAITEGVARYRHLANKAIARGDAASLKPIERLIGYWMPAVSAEIKAQLRAIKGELRRKVVGAPVYAPLVPGLFDDTDALAFITLQELMSRLVAAPMGVYKNSLAYNIGASIASEISIRQAAKLEQDERPWLEMTPEDLVRLVEHAGPHYAAPRVRRWAKRNLPEIDIAQSVLTALGDNMIWAALRTCSCAPWDQQFKRAFVIERRKIKCGNRWQQRRYMLLANEALDIIDEGHAYRELLRPKFRFMLVAPYPWQEKSQGGYISIRTPLVIRPSREQKEAMQQAWEDGGMRDTAECLDAVCAPAWSIMRPVAAVQKFYHDKGGGVADIPTATDVEYPPKPPDARTNSVVLKQWKRARKKVRKANHALRGDRANYHKIAAESAFFSRMERFYCPHELDSRGRTYCKPQPLNHQGGDVCRGLLMPADARPVGERGRWWLHVHAANMFGHDKLEFDARHRWAVENADRMMRTARDPASDEWWHKADKPWQFLAACMALEDPDGIGSRLAVQIDGTANGLQHYCALGRDEIGAAAVSMIPGPRPSDTYTLVAEKVIALIEEDDDESAAIARPYIKRSLVKQPVMTTVYGVTPAGMSRQIVMSLAEAGFTGPGIATVGNYIARKVREAMATSVCKKAAEIMAWIKACATIVSKNGQMLRWTTPLGFPVVQSYAARPTIISAETMLGHINVPSYEGVPVARPRKQINASAPNYIHSLDSTHMMMTARACRAVGVWFAAVHDCYWTHAQDMDTLARLTREQFVELHEAPLLRQLHRQWVALYPTLTIPEPPEGGSYDVRTVLDCPYFFA